VSADLHNYAYHENPLVAGFFLQSGSAFANFKRRDYAHLNFTYAARRLGCDYPYSAEDELECMRQVPFAQIANLVGQYSDNRTRPALEFRPVPDGRTVFNNYTERGERGFISKLPALVSLTANEYVSLIQYPVNNLTDGPNRVNVDRMTVDNSVCMTSNTTYVRALNNLTTYRYQYAGNFSSLAPLPWMGAYHSADLPMLFGTYDRPGVVIDDFQRQTAETMQDYLFDFIVNPENGLRARGWMPDASGPDVDGPQYRFASGGVVSKTVGTLEVDGACLYGNPYNPSP
jgi:carboxylesterase type B